ncbi:hypothetical protein DRO69_13290 [Candidatus Bathyarchaeota archaeon]|nr:MAG: hypothetical protein DRO69_13290 [Candidatus Bathyarchaeota archaeon]
MKKREMLKYVVVGALVVALLSSIYLGIRTNNSLRACLEKNRKGSSSMALHFWLSLGRATDIGYLLMTYRKGLGETEPNEDNIEALIDGFFYEMEYSYWFLYGLRNLNPELSEYEKPLYFIDRLIHNIFWWQSSPTGGPTVRSVLDKLNVTEKVTAFKELNQAPFQKIDDLGREVAESFTWKGVNATRLDNTVNMVEELENVLGQWIDKYSASSHTDVLDKHNRAEATSCYV